MSARNYAKEFEAITEQADRAEKAPSLLLHACCAPCSSRCLELLREHFDVTVYYYNPNITVPEEYEHRKEEELRLIKVLNSQVETGCFPGMHSTEKAGKIGILEAPYEPDVYLDAVKGLENEPEGGARCEKCFALRLSKTAQAAARCGFDYFTTSLTISPLKNADLLNRTGEEAAALNGAVFLPSDFKKKDGYKRSVELSSMFGLYRQNYCGCVFSRQPDNNINERRSFN
ncbi:MAG: epoxyqueuosine reductase QueH [Lachnospiraceae bacterium]|nr:epoxyqueuosine reductase QueH [Lachnospiraceae bacterium]